MEQKSRETSDRLDFDRNSEMNGMQDSVRAKLGFGCVWAALLAVGLTGCAPPKYDEVKAFVQAHNHDVVDTAPRAKPTDLVIIASATCPELDGANSRINTDGSIMLRLLGPVKVSTLNEQEIASKLEKLLTRYYTDPKVEIRLVTPSSRSIYVFGQVSFNGSRPFTGNDTLLDVLAAARPTLISWGEMVRVIRPSADPNEIREITIDVTKMMNQGDLRNNLLLQEGDIVYVPPTPLGWVGLRLQELLFPTAPLMNAYAYPANANNTLRTYQDYDWSTGGSGTQGVYGSAGGFYGNGYGQGW
jgi:protein involved in polysaccharide export with SLBB domain